MSPQDLYLERLRMQSIPLAVALSCWGLFGARADTVTTTTFVTTTVPEFSYFIGPWSYCTSDCGYGTRERQVYCVYTCSVYYCPKAVEAQCPYWDRPADVETCRGHLIPCQETTTNTVTRTTITTTTITTTTATAPPTTEPPPVLEGFECAPAGDTQNCLPAAYADLRCRRGCTCCRAEAAPTTEAPDVPETTVAPEEATEASGAVEVSSEVIIAISVSCAFVLSVCCLVWWRSCNRRAEKARTQKKSEPSEINVKVEFPESPKSTVSQSSEDKRKRKKEKKKSKDGIFDRELGHGVPSAPPSGYYDEPPEWMQAEEASSPKGSQSSPQGKKTFADANGEYYWTPADQPASSPKGSPKGRRRATERTFIDVSKDDDSDEVLTPPDSAWNKFSAGAGTVPDGFVSASRKARCGGKDPSSRPDPFSAFTSDPPPMPGQANTDHSASKGPSRRGMATPPRANEDNGMGGEQRHSSTGSNFRHSQTEEGAGKQERPSSAGAKNTKSDSRQEETSGGAGKDKPSSEDHKKTDPRVAQETAADSAAADLIAKVDLELDQAQSKDLETRRRVFKNLMLKWHPDKNQEEAMATEVFRHVMARRGAFLEA